MLLNLLHAAGGVPCSLEDILVFFSGTDRVPPLGFDVHPSVTFLYDKKLKFATASTCSLQLRLPTCQVDNYSKFKEDMILSLKGNDGFGGV